MTPTKAQVLAHVKSVYNRMFTSNSKPNVTACQFSCQRKSLIEECMVMMKRRSPLAHIIFLAIINHRGFKELVSGVGKCAIDGREHAHTRTVVLTDFNSSISYVVRSDFVPFLQSFYAFVHWESFVTLQLYDRDQTEQSKEWEEKLWETYVEHYKMVRGVTTALHHKTSIY